MKKIIIGIWVFSISHFSIAQRTLTVLADKPVTAVSPQMWGIFFEDINFGADGGLYAELVKNRSFEFPLPMMAWKEIKQQANGKILIINRSKENTAKPRYAHISVDAPTGVYGLSNEGFRGMGIHKNQLYNFSIRLKKLSGDLRMKIVLENSSGKQIGNAILQNFTDQWKKYTVSLTPSDTAVKGHLNILFEGKGTIDVDMVSLFPANTWKNRPNGLRSDLVQLLADLKPGFIRFPGGCIVEGRDLDNRYQWKNTVGSLEKRKLIMNRWNVEFPKKSAPDYYQTFGLGFFEYFQLAEDVGAEALPILNCGMACQYNSGEVVSMNELDPYIKDALDLIEFANGDNATKWGKLRAGMGHAAPFNLKFIGIGNEQWDEQYIDRYKAFEKVIKKKYPKIKLIAAAGPSPDGPRFAYAWKELRKLNADLLDEHYYQSPEWFLKNANRYDNYDRSGPKVFAGEYAAHGKEDPQAESKNTWISALAEAAFMTGLERNADVVQMTSYAPLFAHVDAWQWRPDLIWFDNMRSVGTPNYYVQKLFSNNKGTHVVPILQNGKILAGSDSMYASAVIDKSVGEVVIKLVNVSSAPVTYQIDLQGVESAKNSGTREVLSAKDRYAFNSLEQQQNIYPEKTVINLKDNKIALTLQPISLSVIKVAYKK